MASATSTNPLTEFSTCELSDALIKLGSPNGGLIPDIRRMSQYDGSSTQRVCGPAYTVKMVLTTDSDAPKLSQHFVDTIEEGSVVVIDAPPQVKNAVWGGLMTAGAQVRGALGVVINGRCRDLAEHNLARFPVFARGNSTVGQSPFTRPSAVQTSLSIQAQPEGCGFPGTVVNPGDLIVADEDGVVCVPRDQIEEIARAAGAGRLVDERCMEDIRAGVGVQEAFRRHRGK